LKPRPENPGNSEKILKKDAKMAKKKEKNQETVEKWWKISRSPREEHREFGAHTACAETCYEYDCVLTQRIHRFTRFIWSRARYDRAKKRAEYP